MMLVGSGFTTLKVVLRIQINLLGQKKKKQKLL